MRRINFYFYLNDINDMKTVKTISFTLKDETIKKLYDFSKKELVNRSAFVDKAINDALENRKNKQNIC